MLIVFVADIRRFLLLRYAEDRRLFVSIVWRRFIMVTQCLYWLVDRVSVRLVLSNKILIRNYILIGMFLTGMAGFFICRRFFIFVR